jgi:hypothetical protein
MIPPKRVHGSTESLPAIPRLKIEKGRAGKDAFPHREEIEYVIDKSCYSKTY